tara:strand:+ start:26191 stop:26346 length:156 start_codon:yes stop_codon:yes gene_type:complete
MAIHNQIFEHFRMQEEKLNKAINLLRRHGYSVTKLQKDETSKRVLSAKTVK